MRAMNLVLMWSEGGLELEFSEFAENPTLDGWWELVSRKQAARVG
jgi:bifunctional isochorismate lyase/aryl carrier protein